MLKNDKKNRIALLLQFTASKILSFYSPLKPIDATYTLYNTGVTPTSLVVPQKQVPAQSSTNHEDLNSNSEIITILSEKIQLFPTRV